MRVSRVVCSMLLLAVVLLAIAPAVLSGSPPGKTLRFRANDGSTAAYDLGMSGRAEIKEAAGQKERVEFSTSTRCDVEFLGQTASGDFGIRSTIQPYTLNAKVGANERGQEKAEMAARYTLNALGRVKSVSWLTGNPSMDPAGAGISLTPDDVIFGGAAVLPERPVKKGDKWSGAINVPGAGVGDEETIKYNSVLLGEETFRGIRCQKIKTSATMSETGSEEAPDGSSVVRINVKVTSTATWLFDAERGIIVSIDESSKLSMTVKIEQDGSALASVTVNGVMNIRSTLTEFNGIAVAVK